MPPDPGVPPDTGQELFSGIDPQKLAEVTRLVGSGLWTMMFTDIADSTRITEEVGDAAYFAAHDRHNAALRGCFAAHKGCEIKTIGDSFFVVFADPAMAVASAIAIQQSLAQEPIEVSGHTLAVRIGVHTGRPQVYTESATGRTDLRGGDANKAARVEGLARGGQILISEQTCVLAGPAETHNWGFWELKGLGPHRIFEALYPGKEAEMPAGRMRLEPLRFATSFVGREREVAALMEAVRQHRLITLTGMGGIGKTRLADAAARRLSDAFADGTYFVELATTTDSEEAVVSTLVGALKVNAAGFASETDALIRTMQHRQALLVLDNFEAVMAAAGLVGRLYRNCPRLHLFVTSQAPLDIDGEHIHHAAQMETQPDTDGAASLAGLDAFALFREGAYARLGRALTAGVGNGGRNPAAAGRHSAVDRAGRRLGRQPNLGGDQKRSRQPAARAAATRGRPGPPSR
jgi:class 3 adenylate cyclase